MGSLFQKEKIQTLPFHLWKAMMKSTLKKILNHRFLYELSLSIQPWEISKQLSNQSGCDHPLFERYWGAALHKH